MNISGNITEFLNLTTNLLGPAFESTTAASSHTASLVNLTNETETNVNATTTYTNEVDGGGGYHTTESLAFAVMVATSVIGALGTVGNFIVCLVILRVRALRTITNLFILNQSIIDFTGSVLLLTYNFSPASEIKVPVGLVGEIFCKLWASEYFLWVSFCSSTFNLLVLTVDRYLAINYTMRHYSGRSRKKVYGLCAMVWAAGLIYQIYWLQANYNQGNGACGVHYPTGNLQKGLGIMSFSVEYFIPLVTMIFCYTSMIRTLNKRNIGSRNTVGNNTPSSYHTARENMVRMLCAVCTTFAVCWAPNAILYLNYNLGTPGISIAGPLFQFTKLLAHVTMVFNPLLYALIYKQFQVALKRLFCSKDGLIPGMLIFSTYRSGRSYKSEKDPERNGRSTSAVNKSDDYTFTTSSYPRGSPILPRSTLTPHTHLGVDNQAFLSASNINLSENSPLPNGSHDDRSPSSAPNGLSTINKHGYSAGIHLVEQVLKKNGNGKLRSENIDAETDLRDSSYSSSSESERGTNDYHEENANVNETCPQLVSSYGRSSRTNGKEYGDSHFKTSSIGNSRQPNTKDLEPLKYVVDKQNRPVLKAVDNNCIYSSPIFFNDETYDTKF